MVVVLISVICVFNNKEKLNTYLHASILEQDSYCEEIYVDNTNAFFPSAASALNFGARKANGDILLFAHQDIALCSSTWLREVERIIDTLPDVGIAGVAGRYRGDVMTNIKHDDPPRFAGKEQFTEPTVVQTLDECIIVIPRDIFYDMQFDEKICNDWHLYAVDYCLSIQAQGKKAYVLPLKCYHESAGASFSQGYFTTLEKMRYKHSKNHNLMYTTMGTWSLRLPTSMQRNKIWSIITYLHKQIYLMRNNV